MSEPMSVDPIREFVSEVTQDTIFPTTVNLMKNSCSVVLNRIKQNLDATVAEKSEGQIANFITEVTKGCSRHTNAWIDINSAQLMVVPEGTKLVYRDSSRVTIVVEQKPSVRTIAFNGSHRGANIANYRISLPYIQYFITFNSMNGNDVFSSMFMSCTKKTLQSLNDVVYRFPLPNVNTNGSVCVGNMNTGTMQGQNLVEKIDSIITGFWQARFNYDLSDSMLEFWNLNFPNNEQTLYHNRFPLWVEKTNEDALYALKATYQEIGAARSLIRNDVGNRNSIDAVKNEIKETIRQNITSFIRNLTSDLNAVNILEENRNQPHVATLNDGILNIARQSFNKMWHKVHNAHERKVIEDNRNLDRKKTELENVVNRHSDIIRKVESEKQSLTNEEVRVKCELYRMYQYLEKQIESVNELKSKLSSYIDENGNIIEKKKRGRPRKERVPSEIQSCADNVVSSNYVLNPDGSRIVRKRGRPRKNAIVS